MTTTGLPAAPAAPSTGSAQGTVRRLIVYTLLFVLVTIAAIGLSGLLGRLLEVGDPLAIGGNAGLALSLAFALIGGPLAAVLWWVVWRRLAEETERSSLAWGLYLTVMYTVSLIVATSALVGTASALVGGRWLPGDFSVGAVWALVWVWHRWMWRHPVKHPTRLAHGARGRRLRLRPRHRRRRRRERARCALRCGHPRSIRRGDRRRPVVAGSARGARLGRGRRGDLVVALVSRRCEATRHQVGRRGAHRRRRHGRRPPDARRARHHALGAAPAGVRPE